jgi:hypothetical protein
MTYAPFYDQVLSELILGSLHDGMIMLVGMLDTVSQDEASLAVAATSLRQHGLYELLLKDPLCALGNSTSNPGEALSDLICDRKTSPNLSSTGQRLFDVTRDLTFARAVQGRRRGTEDRLMRAWQSGQRICVLGHGQLRALQVLRGLDVSNVTVVSKDSIVLARLGEEFGASVKLVYDETVAFLSSPSASTARFDLICACDLPDRHDAPELAALLLASRASLTETGKVLFASFVPQHLGAGWRSICLGWALTCHRKPDLIKLAEQAGLEAHIHSDVTNSIVWSEFTDTHPHSSTSNNSYSGGAKSHGH